MKHRKPAQPYGFARTLRPLTVTVLAVSLHACSAASDRTAPGSNNFTPAANTIVGFSRSLVSKQALFSAYVPKAERLTVLDPATLKEIWGTQVGGQYIDAVPLANFDGIALAGANDVRVYSGSAYRSFALDSFAENTSWAVSRDTPTMVFAAKDGKSARLIRNNGGADWSEKSFAVASDADTKVVGTLLSNSGDVLMTIATPPGSFDLYRTPYSSPLSCRYSKDQWTDSTIFRAGFLDEKNNVVLLADENGKLYVLDVSATATCSEPRDWSAMTLPARVNYFTQLKDGSFAAALNNGVVILFAVTGTTPSVNAEIATPCPSAIGVLEGTAREGDSGMLIVHCPGEIHSYALPGKTLIKSIQVSTTHGLTPAFDGTTNHAYYLDNGGIGTAHAVNLVTGETRTRKGLFVRNIFSSR